MDYPLTIITINYNNLSGLIRTCESVLSQKKSFEYVVIDGGSEDGSREYLESYSGEIDYWISEKDRGVFNAQNKGLQKANGRYVLFLNSGDFLYSHSIISEVLPMLDREEIVTGDLIFDIDGKRNHRKYSNDLSLQFFIDGSLPHPSTFIKRELFFKFGLYDEDYKIVADWEWWLRTLIIHNATFKYIPKVISVFDTTGLSSRPENKQAQSKEREDVLTRLFPRIIVDYEKHEIFKNKVAKQFILRVFRKIRLINV